MMERDALGRICDEVEREFGMGGLTYGVYEDFARAVATRYAAEDTEGMRRALIEISKGRGPYKRDPLDHADSCIAAMKQVALDALAGKYPESEDDG